MICKTRITVKIFCDDSLALAQELGQLDDWNLETNGVLMAVTFERQYDQTPPVDALYAELSAHKGDFLKEIASMIYEGKYTEEDVTPNLDNISVQMLFDAAANEDLKDALVTLTCQAGITDWSWFESDDYEFWADCGVQQRLSDLVEWLLAVKEGRA